MSVSILSTNDLSILSKSIGRLVKYDNDAKPVPKSSRAIFMPSFLSASILAAAMSIAWAKQYSVISISRHSGGKSASNNASSTFLEKPVMHISLVDILIERTIDSFLFFTNFLNSLKARFITYSSILVIKLESSATGINSPGLIILPSGVFRRINVSKPLNFLLFISNCG